MNHIQLTLNVLMIIAILFLGWALFQWAVEVGEYNQKIEELGCKAVCKWRPVNFIVNSTNITYVNST